MGIQSIFFVFIFLLNNSEVNLISNRYFDIYYPPERKEVAMDISDYSVGELERISGNLYITSTEKIRISILNEKEFNKKYGSFLPEWGVGFAIPEQDLILLKFPISFSKPSRIKFIVGHEIAHILIHRKAQVSIPRWFDEGAAIYLSKEPNFIDEIKLATAIIFRKIIPLKNLEETFPTSTSLVNLAYIESASTIQYLTSEYGPYILNQILNETRVLKDFRKGFLVATGIDLTLFQIEWNNWLRKRFTLTFLLKPNILFLLIAILVLIIGIKSRLRRTSSRSIDECIED